MIKFRPNWLANDFILLTFCLFFLEICKSSNVFHSLRKGNQKGVKTNMFPRYFFQGPFSYLVEVRNMSVRWNNNTGFENNNTIAFSWVKPLFLHSDVTFYAISYNLQKNRGKQQKHNITTVRLISIFVIS